MKRPERLNQVLDLLAEKEQVEIDDLVDMLGISAATARRDLDALAQQRLLTRTHGGAVGQSVAYDLPLRYKRERFMDEKKRIAEAASELVPVGSVIGLVGGTTSTAVANALGARTDLESDTVGPGLTVVTNAINIAAQLVVRPQIKTVVTGGVVHARSYELVGSYAEEILQRVTLDTAFIGVNGIDPLIGATVHDDGEAKIAEVMSHRASRAIIVADSSKVGRKAFATVGALGTSTLKTLITDIGISADAAHELERMGIEVIAV